MVKESILPMSNVHKPRIQIGHDFSDATDINVAHGVLHISPISVQLYELPVFEKGNVDASWRRVDDEFRVHHMKSRSTGLAQGQPRTTFITSSCDGFCEDASSACASPSCDACVFFRLA